MSGYIKTDWSNRVVQYPRRATISLVTGTGSIDDGDGIELTPTPGAITDAGTPTNQTNMNNMEDGIYNLYNNKLRKIRMKGMI